MADILELTFFMWIIAVASFAPLGYFIYLFTIGDGESFGKSDPSNHSVEHTKHYHIINRLMQMLLGSGGSNTLTNTATQSAPPARQAVEAQREPVRETVRQKTPTPTAAATSSAFTAATWSPTEKKTGKKKAKKKSK